VAADDFGDCNVLGDDRDAATLLMSSITSVGTYNGIDNSATANNSIDGGSTEAWAGATGSDQEGYVATATDGVSL
jgi:hypothetical protein